MLKSAHKSNKYLPLIKAYEFVAGHFPGVSPNDNFMTQLIRLEKQLFDSASIQLNSSNNNYKKKKNRRR